MINNIKSRYILKIIIEHLIKKNYFKLFRYNKELQTKLDINLDDYKRIFNSIEMELIPIEKLKPDIKYYFIKMRENLNYYHIYFDNDEKTEIKRNYLTNKDKVKKIAIKIDIELKSLTGLFTDCLAPKEITFTKFNREDFTDMKELFYGCNNLEKLDIQKFKTPIIDSVILNGTGKQNEFEKKIKEWTGYKHFELLYRGNRDGTTSKIFHNKCDNKGPTLCLYKNEKGYVFGGYASISWTSDGNYHSAPESFIFTLTNIHGTEPLKFPNSNTEKSVFHHSSYGPTFGWSDDIKILEDFKIKESTTNFPCRFKDVSNKGKSIFTGDLDNNKQSFKIDEIEVFKILK